MFTLLNFATSPHSQRLGLLTDNMLCGGVRGSGESEVRVEPFLYWDKQLLERENLTSSSREHEFGTLAATIIFFLSTRCTCTIRYCNACRKLPMTKLRSSFIGRVLAAPPYPTASALHCTRHAPCRNTCSFGLWNGNSALLGSQICPAVASAAARGITVMLRTFLHNDRWMEQDKMTRYAIEINTALLAPATRISHLHSFNPEEGNNSHILLPQVDT